MNLLLILLFAISWVPPSRTQCQHSVVLPKGFRIDTDENIFIDFHGCPDPVSIHTTLRSSPNRVNIHDEKRQSNIHHGNRPVKIQLKATSELLETLRDEQIYEAKLYITYTFPLSGRQTNVAPMNILLNKTHGYAFMTTNRPAYRPKDKVNIKVLVTNQYLKLDNKRQNVTILIKSPVERITVYNDGPKKTDGDGFVDFTYEVPDIPIKGIWWAEACVNGVKMAEKSFLVDRYVLPTFDVKIIPKFHFFIPQTNISGIITAKYSYGKKVSGLCYLSLKLIRGNGEEVEFYKRPARFDRQFLFTRGETGYSVDGRKIERVLKEGETMQDLIAERAKISITASVTSSVESVFESDYVDDILITNEPYFIDHSQSARFYVPQVFYVIRITIRDTVSKEPLQNVLVTIEWGNGQTLVRRTDENGKFYYEVNGFTQQLETIIVSAVSVTFGVVVKAKMQVRMHNTDRALVICLNKQVVEVNEGLFVRFALGNNKPTDIRYFVIARGTIVHVDSIAIPAHQRKVTKELNVTAEMVPSARIVAYYVLNNQMSSDSVWFDVVDRCENELEITTGNITQVLPGNTVSIAVKGAPGTAFFLHGIDQASYFLHNRTRVSRNQLWSKMEEYDTGCSRRGGQNATHVFDEAGMMILYGTNPVRSHSQMYCSVTRTKRSSPMLLKTSDNENELQRCRSSGIKKNLFGRTCEERENKIRENFQDGYRSESDIASCVQAFHGACLKLLNSWEPALMRSANKAENSGQRARRRPRKKFNEEWSFSRAKIEDNGVYRYGDKLTQHSITTFELDAFGMSRASPMCVAKTKYVKLFKDLFIQLHLPYSVRLREQTTIHLSVFNYGAESKTVDIKLKHSDHLCSRFQGKDLLHLNNLDIRPNDAQSTYFTVLPLNVGEALITVALFESDQEHAEDTVEKVLLIEDEGVHNESSATIVIKARDNGRAKVQRLLFDFPKASVMMSQTRKCEIYAYAHAMGPNIEIDPFDDRLRNIGNYINMPGGCGEQNIASMAPVVYIHAYRKSAMQNQVTETQNRDVMRSVTAGFTNQLSHRSDATNQKAFAVYRHSTPWTWLNAFVVKVFTEAREYLNDLVPICRALKWLISMQQDDGHFLENVRRWRHDDTTLTAYVTVSLAEAEIACPQHENSIRRALKKGLSYVKQHYDDATVDSNYSLAMSAYAIALSEKDIGEKSELALRLNRMLRNRKQYDGEHVFWRGTRGPASDIETTSYALLAEVTLNRITAENAELTRNTAHWLVSQRNALGGYRSSQDTLVAMQALTMYMTILDSTVSVRPLPTDLTVNLSPLDADSNWNPEQVRVTGTDRMLSQTIEVDSTVAKGVEVSVTGNGVGSLTYRCTWQQFNNDENCVFILEVNVTDDERNRNKKIVTVEAKTKTGDPPAGMSIIDFGLLSGWSPDEDSIKDISPDGAVDHEVDRYEITNNAVKFYIPKIDENGARLGFKINKDADIVNSQPAAVSAYDYYEPDIKCTKFYNIEDRAQILTAGCKGDSELCRCAEGDCPVCRTRKQQIKQTYITLSVGFNTEFCDSDATCDNMHTILCLRKYAYIVTVMEVRNDAMPGFKYFLGEITESFRTNTHHESAINSIAKFLIRNDCNDKCKDSRFESIARKKKLSSIPEYIRANRTLLVSGIKEPVKLSDNRYEYDLSGGGIEVMVPSDICGELLRVNMENLKKKKLEKRKICDMKSILRAAIVETCDV